MVMDLPTIHQLITVILQPTRSSVSKFIVGHICVLAGGGEDGVASAVEMVGRRLSQEEAKRLLAKFDCILSRTRRCNSHAGRAKPDKYKSGRPFLCYTYRQLPELLPWS
jgi:hypothetical protein